MRVRFHDWFFNQARSLLGDERGDDGTPSAHDFLLVDLPMAQARLEEDFKRWATPSEPEGTWTITVPGKLVKAFALKFHFAPDGVVEVYDLAIERWEPE